MKMIKKLFVKYKELITYVFFGGLTTVVNLIAFKLCGTLIGDERYLISNAVAWVAAVIFAFITNKLWVFESKSLSSKVLLKELPSFFAARVLSFLIEEAGLFILIDMIGFSEYSLKIMSIELSGEMISKLILAVVVVIFNYFCSKLIIFKKKK